MRRLVFDHLSAEQVGQSGAITGSVLEALDAAGHAIPEDFTHGP